MGSRAFHRRLLAWFAREKRDLPWRRTRDPYRIWVSEVMLQQTQVATVIPYYERFVARFPDVRALARARLDTLLGLWSGLGYYARARNMHRAAKAVASEHRGRFPDTLESLRALPGFGPYTAAAVASIAFGRDEPLVDGNVRRVLARWTASDRDAWEIAHDLFPRGRGVASNWNQALMELGATVCLPKAPRCDACPVAPLCAAQSKGSPERWPPARKRPLKRALLVRCALHTRDGRVLLVRRAAAGLFGGLWELPPARAPSRVRPLARVHATLTHRELTIEVFVGTGTPPAGRWFTRTQLARAGLSSAMRRALDAALQRIGSKEGARDSRPGRSEK